VSGAEDGVFRIWRWSKETTSLEMVGQHSVGKGRVTGACCSNADPGIVVTSDEGGERSGADESDLVAIGCKLGLVLLVSVTGWGGFNQLYEVAR
jgi:hypothetical protein